MLSLGAEAHHPLDTGTVIPTAVKEHEFLGRRQIRNITLEVPRRTVPVRGFAEGDNAGFAWTQVLDNALDRAVLAGRIPALQDDQDLVIAFDEVPLQLDQFDLEFAQAVLVGSFSNPRARARSILVG